MLYRVLEQGPLERVLKVQGIYGFLQSLFKVSSVLRFGLGFRESIEFCRKALGQKGT